jgi:hypothetical protein
LNLSERVLCVLLQLCDWKNDDDDSDSVDSSVRGLICESDECADELSELRSSDDDSDCDDFYEMIFFVP